MMLPIRGTSLGNPDDAATIAIARGGKNPEHIRRYARSLWNACARLGIRADVAFGQADLETGNRETGIGFQSRRWVEEGNPAGLGIVTNMPDDEEGRTFMPEEWADIHAAHLAGYAGIDPGPDLRMLDFRWDDMIRAGYFGSTETVDDLDQRWAWDPRGPQGYGGKIEARWRLYDFPAMRTTPAPQPENDGGNDMALTFGHVPHPGYVDLQHTTADKPEGRGWDNLGRRTPKFIALHRMWGTLRGTDVHFANPDVPSLTDYGIGSGNIDGPALDGVIHKYNDPRGYRSGWASGRVSAPYGDGACIVSKYGVTAVNRDGVSIETSGYDTEPFTAFAWSELVNLCAYWIDQMRIPYTSLPLNPHTGCNAIIWHEEFTFGTGKQCPFTWMKANTNRLYRDIQAYLKPFQEGAAGQPEPESEEPEVPKPQYAPPAPIVELVPFTNADTNPHIVTRQAGETLDEFHFVGDRVVATERTPRLQYAVMNARHTGPYIEEGEAFDVDWKVRAADGHWYYITPYWTRIRADHVERIADTKGARQVDPGKVIEVLEDVLEAS